MTKKNLNNKLHRYARFLSTSNEKDSRKPALPTRYKKLADHTRGELTSLDAGSFCLVKTFYPLSYQHGDYSLQEMFDTFQPAAAFHPDFSLQEIDHNSLLFIDTETTGLGGSGTVPFLIGVGSVTPKGFEVRQYLLPDYSDEAAMLDQLNTEFSDQKILVSYNGISFDLPLLLDRFIVNRQGRAIPQQEHIDLLHSVRRLFKRRMKNCKLTQVEETLFSFFRHDDVPGFLVPSIYFEWVNNEDLEYMNGVLEHNRLDIISLYYLYQLIGRFYRQQGGTSLEVDDLHSLAKLFHRQLRPDSGDLVFQKIEEIQQHLPDDILLFHAFSFKRRKKWLQAIPLFQRLGEGSGKEAFLALIELAKYAEHKEKNILSALEFTRKAMIIGPVAEGGRKSLEHRLKRLLRKAG